MKTEMTESEMVELGWRKVGNVYTKTEDGVTACADALPNGNAPVGGQHYKMVSDLEAAALFGQSSRAEIRGKLVAGNAFKHK